MSLPGMIACPRCRANVPPGSGRCPQCGTALKPTPIWRTNFRAANPPVIQIPPRSHPVGVAIALAFIPCIVGMGQIANRQKLKGILLVIATEASARLFFHQHDAAGLVWLLLYVLSIIDTALIARKLQRGQPIGQWTCF